jgi:hypothetical protein
MAKRTKVLTPEEAARAIYVSLEGAQTGAPVLLGALWASRPDRAPLFRQFVVDPTFASAGTPVEDPPRALSRLFDRATQQDRMVVVWSSDAAGAFAGRLRFGATTAKRWREICRPEVAFERDGNGKRNRLDRYLGLVADPVPARFAPSKVDENLGVLRRQLEKGIAFDDLRPTTKRRWEDVLGANERECRGMHEVCVVAAEEYAAATAPSAHVDKKRRRGKGKKAA